MGVSSQPEKFDGSPSPSFSVWLSRMPLTNLTVLNLNHLHWGISLNKGKDTRIDTQILKLMLQNIPLFKYQISWSC